MNRVRHNFANGRFSSSHNVSFNVFFIYSKNGHQKPNLVRLVGYFLTLAFFVPYLERDTLRSLTPAVSRAPRTIWYFTPGKSFTRPPRTRTIECSCKL